MLSELIDHSFKNHSRFIPVGDALICCGVSGREDAPAMVFLHGNGEAMHVFNPQVRYFSQKYRTIAVETRSHGLSSRGTAPFNFFTFATDLLIVFRALKIDKAHVIGFSDGAITALHLAIIAPEYISSMVLLGANYNPRGLQLLHRLYIRLAYAGLAVASLFSAEMRRRMEIWGLMVHHPHLTLEELSQIEVPTLVVTGEKDIVSQRHNDEISRAIAGAKRHVAKSGDHFWMMEDSDEFNRLVEEFVSQFVSPLPK